MKVTKKLDKKIDEMLENTNEALDIEKENVLKRAILSGDLR